MGYNTTVVVLNDGLGDIERDPEFGKKLARAISAVNTERYLAEQAGRDFYGVDVSAGNHCNAATVVETHHAEGTAVVAVGGNMGRNLGHVWPYGDEEYDVRVLKALADKLGYSVRRKPKRRR